MKGNIFSLSRRVAISLGVFSVALALPIALPAVLPSMSTAPYMPVLMVPAQAQTPSPLAQLTPEELLQVKRCVQEIKNRQIQSGAMAGALLMTDDGTFWVENYFGLQGALALLSVTNDGNSEEAEAVRKYLVWYASAIDPNEGVAHNYQPNKLTNPGYDALDSLAGLYLLASARYYKMKGSLPPEVVTACRTSLQTLNDVIRDKQKVVDHFTSTEATNYFPLNQAAKDNGLSIDTGSHCQHYLADNVETFSGASEGAALFSALGYSTEATLATSLATSVANASALFQTPDRFAFDVNEINIPLDNDSSRGLRAYANLFGLAFLPAKYPNLWAELKRDYGSTAALDADDAVQNSAAPSELWLLAATRVAPGEASTFWRPRVVENAKAFGGSTYMGRLAVTVLALVGGKASYPVINDKTAPQIAIETPTNNQNVAVTSFNAITGTATDSYGVTTAQIKLFRTRNNVRTYWNGSAFTTTDTPLNVTLASPNAKSSSWTYAVSPALKAALDSGQYLIYAYAKDPAGNLGNAPGRVFNVVIDTEKPVIATTTPTQSQFVSANSLSITGTASDNTGVTSVQIRLFRTRSGIRTYWNGEAFTTTEVPLATTLASPNAKNTLWSYPVSSALKAALDTGEYLIYAAAKDAVGNQGNAVGRTFTIDLQKPLIATVSPAQNSTVAISAFNTITGTASDNYGVKLVQIKLFRTRNGVRTYWNGSTFTTTETALTATLATPNATATNWSYSVSSALKSALDNGSYTLYALAKDAASNQGDAIGRTFSLTGSSQNAMASSANAS